MDFNGVARRAAKGALAGAVHYSGAQRALVAWRRRRAGGRRIVLVSYHRVVPDFPEAVRTSIPGLLISQRTFRRHLEQAAAAGFELSSLEDALLVLSGQRRARKDLLVVTFDDGYRDVAQYAAPVLRQMGAPAVCYLATGFIGTDRRFDHDRLNHLAGLALAKRAAGSAPKLVGPALPLLEPVLRGRCSVSESLDDFISRHPRPELLATLSSLEQALSDIGELSPQSGEPMSWDDARRLAREGFTLGAHTENHAVLTLLDEATATAEIRSSKESIERETGQLVRDFAYCNGWYSRELVRLLVAQGFRSAVTTEDLPNRIGGDPFALKRKVLWENFSLGLTGRFSSALTSCQLDDVFGILGLSNPVPGLRANTAIS